MTGEFGPSLRRERERRGITLEEIAAQTKIAASFFAALERNDVSRWPGGIFRKSFFRAYAQHVGLEAERLMPQFLRLFPAGEDLVAAHSGTGSDAASPEAAPQRSTVTPFPTRDHAGRQPSRPAGVPVRSGARQRLAATAVDLALVLLAAVGSWLVGGWVAVWPTIAVAALLIFVGGNVVLASTFGTWLVSRAATPAPTEERRPAAVQLRAVPDDRVVKRRSAGEPHQPARRHAVRRIDRSRSSRA